MRRSVRDLTKVGYTVLGPVNPVPSNPRYTQMPSEQLSRRKPCLDPVMTGGHEIRKPTLEEGVSFCEPIQPDWEW